ncbi:hypothetical protein, partial [Prevotella sp.]|uniref:hypothetical protein n=1 Tax=Prevotella sp. TaxID=59823 RepID=UPI002F951F7A
MKLKQIFLWPAEKLSQRVLYVLMGFVAVVFFLFYFVGYDMPYWESPDFNAPFFTDGVLWLSIFFVVVALALIIGRCVIDVKKARGAGNGYENNVPVRKLNRYLWLSLLAVVVLTAVFASSRPLTINGAEYTDGLWLKTADVFIYTGAALLVAAFGAVIYGATRYRRKGTLK